MRLPGCSLRSELLKCSQKQLEIQILTAIPTFPQNSQTNELSLAVCLTAAGITSLASVSLKEQGVRTTFWLGEAASYKRAPCHLSGESHGLDAAVHQLSVKPGRR